MFISTTMYPCSPERETTEHEEVELLIEAYYADFEEIVAEIKTIKVNFLCFSCSLLYL